MPLKIKDLADGIPVKRQIIAIQQIGNNVDKTFTVEVAPHAAGNVIALTPPFVKGRGILKRIFAGNMTTALTVDATMGVQLRRFRPSNGLARAAATEEPLVVDSALELSAADLAGVIADLTVFQETEVISVLQAPGAADVIKLAAADAQPDGFYANAEVEIIAGGAAKGQKNVITGYTNGTKVATLLNADGSYEWRNPTVVGDTARIVTRHYKFEKDDVLSWVLNFTVAAGAAGVDLMAGAEIEYRDLYEEPES